MNDPQKKQTINILYIFLIISSVLGCVPNIPAALLSMAMAMVVLIAAYIYKARDDKDGLLYNHMVYLIGTIWISSVLLLIGMSVAGSLVYAQGDHSVIHEAANNVLNGGGMPDEKQMYDLTLRYVEANKRILLMSGLCFIAPSILYFVYRIANGYSRAMKGYRIANPKSWL